MNERLTLTLFGWTIGAVVGLMFLLNALSLASLQRVPEANPHQLASQAEHPVAIPLVPGGQDERHAARDGNG